MSKKGLVITVITLLVIAGVLIVVATDENGEVPQDNGRDEAQLGEEVTHADVRVEAPEAGDTISSPVTLRGEARGTWYFEASFSAQVTDNQGRILAEVPVQAQGEWMTEDFVPFETTISWTEESPEVGFIVLEKANPSGLPENAAEVKIPVFFEGGESTQTQNVSVYFSDDMFGAETECGAVIDVTRQIPRTQAVARAAIEELLKGPAADEQNVVTSIPDGVELNSIRVEGGTAFIDFSEELNQVGGSCRVTAIRAQITETLMQFSTVDDVVISVNGDVETALQP